MTHTPKAWPYRLEEPAVRGPVVVEIPHAGLELDPESRRGTRVSEQALRADADLHIDAIWAEAPLAGATLLVARASRYVIDLNTAPRLPSAYEDKLPPGLRSLRRRSASGEAWTEEPLSRAELQRRVDQVFEPYHAALAHALEQARTHCAAAVLISAHSYPEALFPGAADLVIGTRGGACASELLRDRVAGVARAAGLTVALDTPFPGGHSLARHAQPARAVHGLQIELARRLYLEGGEPVAERVAALRTVMRRVVEALAAAVVDGTAAPQR